MQGSLHVGIRKHLSFSAEILRADYGNNRDRELPVELAIDATCSPLALSEIWNSLPAGAAERITDI